jgi:hypothetical protein
MEEKNIKQELAEYNSINVENFVNYLNKLIADTKNSPWAKAVSDKIYIDLFKKVSKDDIFIDGDIITLSQRYGKIVVDYSYQAYRKKLLMLHPETKIDAQCVYKGDTFHFEKNSGKVEYNHVFSDPFNQVNKNLEGSYCIVKNSLGEFIEILNKETAKKMREAATTDNVWNNWEDRMYLKSPMKRLCKTFFYDSFQNIESIDNENYDLDLVGVDEEKQGEIRAKAQLTDMKVKVKTEFKKYSREDKATIKKEWVEKHEAHELDAEYVSKIYMLLKSCNLLDSYTGEDKDVLIETFNALDEITESAFNSLMEKVNA